LKKKIILISRKYPPSVGGMQSYSRDFVQHLSRYYDINLIVLGKSQIHLLWFLPYAFVKTFIHILVGRYQALYVCDGMLAPVAVVIKYITGIKSIITIHGLDITYKNYVYQAIVPYCVSLCDRIVCVSNSTLEECTKRGIAKGKCIFIPNGIDAEKNTDISYEFSTIFKNYPENIYLNKKVLLSVGRLVPRKGISWFIENILSKLDDTYTYVVVGEGPERKNISETIELNNSGYRVKLLGKIEEGILSSLYKKSYAFIMPNMTAENDPEGFGIVILEASRAGLPVIAHDVDGINDAVINGKTGWLVPEGDKEQMISKINNLKLDRAVVKEASSAFEWTDIICRYKEVIDEVIADYPVKIFSVTMTPIRPPFDDGPKNIVYGIAKRLNKYKFYFISSIRKRFPYSKNITFVKSPFQRKYHHSMPLSQKIFILFVIAFNSNKIDLLQFFFTPNRVFSNLCRWMLVRSQKKSIQIISSIHTLLKNNDRNNIKDLFFSDAVIVQTDYAKKILAKEGITNVKRIYPGIDLKRYKCVYPEGKYGSYFDTDKRHILYPGNYGLLKDSYSFVQICNIFQMILKEHDDVDFVMACRLRSKRDFVLEKEFKNVADGEGLQKYIRYFNTVENMPAFMDKCSIGILPVEKEMTKILEIPLVVIEMAVMGKPFVYGNVSPMEELMDKGIGYCPGHNTPESYADLVNTFLSDKELADKTGLESKNGVEKYFNISKTAEEYSEVYNKLSGM